jgi:hypothetical protein
MKISVWLCKYNTNGTLASIQFDDESCGVYLDPKNKDPKKACQEAAKALREAADDFEKLVKLPNPLLYEAQEKFNRKRAKRP